ncbi:putative 2OG-Fe(II) oxygenase [Actinomadura sp. 1N219]|uniref:putative 2OG-Fe(II) oxygenase n=1 Tax=Actinomadura sp. 1N219 TaxID=3375152 RepID=UPI0037AD7737
MTDTGTSNADDTLGDISGGHPAAAERLVLQMWRTPVYQADCAGAAEHLPNLRTLILEAEEADRRKAADGGITVIKSSQTLLSWSHPSIDWLRHQISVAGQSLAHAVMGEAADEIGDDDVHAEAWAVVCRAGDSLRPHTRHDSAWSGVLSVAAEPSGDSDAGYLRMLDPRPAAMSRTASPGPVSYSPVPGRMIAFPGWQAHWMRATAADSRLRIAIAWNIAYHERWSRVS